MSNKFMYQNAYFALQALSACEKVTLYGGHGNIKIVEINGIKYDCSCMNSGEGIITALGYLAGKATSQQDADE